MIEIFKNKTHIDFVGKFHLAGTLSGLMVLGTILLVLFKGLNYGVDFRGGAEIQVKFKKEISLNDLRNGLAQMGHAQASVQSIGDPESNEFLIKVAAAETNLNQVTSAISEGLAAKFSQNGIEIRKTDIVGPKAGAELRISAIKALIYSLLAIAIYVGLRFDFKYAPGVLLSLLHDATITLGFFALTGREFSLQIVAALLAIIGYSVNDTVVIYDRVREHEDRYPGADLKVLINTALNETLSRTVLTAGATLIVCIIMVFLGGPVIRDFFIALVVGMVFGCYSSLYVAVPLTLFFDKSKKIKA